jgi:hypothetical protein
MTPVRHHPPMADPHPDSGPQCAHTHSEAEVSLGRLTDGEDGPVVAYEAMITVKCQDCGIPYVWIGVPAGISPRQPTVDISGTQLHVPLRPQNTPEDFGQAGPAYGVSIYVEGEAAHQ